MSGSFLATRSIDQLVVAKPEASAAQCKTLNT